MTVRFAVFGIEMFTMIVELPATPSDAAPVDVQPTRRDKLRKTLAMCLIR